MLYFAAALLLGLIPANAAWRQAESGIAIFVRTNGVHTWILMPKTNAHMDWRPFIPGADVRDPRWDAANYVAFGYGEREVYLNTPTWGDLSVAHRASAPRSAAASRWSMSSMSMSRRRTRTRAASYCGLTNIAASPPSSAPASACDARGRTMPVLGRGYGDNDIFYEANGGYSAILTCNEWTGRALRTAGVRTGLWTPLEQSIMWRLD